MHPSSSRNPLLFPLFEVKKHESIYSMSGISNTSEFEKHAYTLLNKQKPKNITGLLSSWSLIQEHFHQS